MQILDSEADIEAAVRKLMALEPRFGVVLETHGAPPLRRVEAGLEGLLRIITGQLISVPAGAAIWRRLEAGLAPFDAKKIARRRETSLMRLGISNAKARCFKAVAAAVAGGKLDFASLVKRSDREVLATLTALTGIGPWTADIFLLSAMGRSDAWPAGDLALQVAAQHLFGLGKRPSGRELMEMAEPWRPWRSVAARLLWSHYRGLKGISQTVA
ncbi:MAG: DNA-3-methyladenine glycosylase family protein [Aestuariivirga sp.]